MHIKSCILIISSIITVILSSTPVYSQLQDCNGTNHPWSPHHGTIVEVSNVAIIHTLVFTSPVTTENNFTYEHDTIISRKGWLESDNWWSSTLPNAYLDTQAFDFFTGTEDVFTVGSWRAKDIIPNIVYRIAIGTDPENPRLNDSPGKLTAQRGHRRPSFCHSKYCIFPDESCKLTTFFAPVLGAEWTRP